MLAEQLKKSILQAAIQGKLTNQRKEDGTAQDLYNQIQEEKQRLIKEKKIKKTKSLPVITEDEIPFEIPENWMWVRLGKIVSVLGGKRIPKGAKLQNTPTNYRYIRVADMEHNTVNISDVKYISEEIYQKIKKYTISDQDIYITVAGTIGKVGTIPHELNNANLTENANKLVLYNLNKEFLCYAMQSPVVKSQIESCITRVSQPKLAIKRIEGFVIPLPPLAEQKRIADTIQKYLAEIEQLEKDEEALAELQKAFPGKMKASILQQAIQGKLTDQRKEDGSAQDLYKEIQDEKQKLIKEKKIPKPKTLPPITEDEIPFDIPENWMWVKLGNVSDYGGTKLKVSPDDIDNSTWVLDMEDIEKESGKILLYKTGIHKSIKGDRAVFSKGDILYSKLRPYLKKILIAPEDGVCTTELVPFSCYGGVNHQYIVSVLRSPYVTNIVNAASYGVKMPRVGKDIMENLIIPLPPLAEQKRIVEKLDKLLPLCEA